MRNNCMKVPKEVYVLFNNTCMARTIDKLMMIMKMKGLNFQA
ncbi:MAG: hypothetical protein ACLFR2_09675 [Candidatus Kapaibacterium sp.]